MKIHNSNNSSAIYVPVVVVYPGGGHGWSPSKDEKITLGVTWGIIGLLLLLSLVGCRAAKDGAKRWRHSRKLSKEAIALEAGSIKADGARRTPADKSAAIKLPENGLDSHVMPAFPVPSLASYHTSTSLRS